MRIKSIVLRVQKVQLDALLWLTDPMNRAETELLLQRFTSIGQVASLRVALMGALESMTSRLLYTSDTADEPQSVDMGVCGYLKNLYI